MASADESGIAQAGPSIKDQNPSGQNEKKIVVENKNSLAEMRQWLNRRNMDRKLKGSALQGGLGNSKFYSSTLKPLIANQQKSTGLGWATSSPQSNHGLFEPKSEPSPNGEITATSKRGRSAEKGAHRISATKRRQNLVLNRPLRAGSEPAPDRPLELFSTTLSPDGRIHHRLIINEEGPDQFQAITGTGYAVPNSIYPPKSKRWIRPPFKK